MKIFKKLLFAGLAFTSMSVFAQTADEIVSKNIEAMGGAAKIASLTSVKKTGTLSAQGMDIPMTFTVEQNKGFRLDVEVMGTSNYQIVTPDKASMFFPIQQMTEPKEMDAETVKGMQSSLDIQGQLYNYKDKGTALEYVATEKVDGADAYKLKATNKSGKVSYIFIDTKSNRVIKSTSKSKGPDGEEMDIEALYSDYKQNADGYWFAYSTTSPQGPIVFDKIETNIKIDQSIFKD